MVYDGSITISTKIDQSGFNKGRKSLKSGLSGIGQSLKGIAAAAAVAFSATTLINFGKQAVNVASDLQEVQNVVDTAFGDMSHMAESFADTAIENFGMSELSAKRTASTYMAMSKGLGLYGEQAAQMAIDAAARTGDIASFYNMTQEEVDTLLKSIWTGETETLKRIGVVMTQANLDAYALAEGYGKVTSQMSQAELVQLRFAFVMEQTSLAAGDFVKTQGSWANQTRILQERWNEFLGLLGDGLVQVLTPLLQMLNNVLSALIEIAKAINQTFFGGSLDANTDSQQSMAASADAAAASENALAEATENAAKAAQKSLASFDELNVRQQETESSAASGTASAKVLSTQSEEQKKQNQDITSPLAQSLQANLQRLINPLRSIDFEPAAAAFDRLKKSIEPFTKTLFDGLLFGYNNIFVPLAKWTIEEALPRFLDTLGKSVEIAGGILDIYFETFKSFYNEVLKPVGDFAGKKVLEFWDKFNNRLDKLGKKIKSSGIKDDLRKIIEAISPTLTNILNSAINSISFIIDLITNLAFDSMEFGFEQFGSVVAGVADLLNGDFSGALNHAYDLLIGNGIDFGKNIFSSVGDSILSFLGLNDKAVEQIDIFGEEISDATKQKVQPFIEKIEDLDDALAEIDYSEMVITDETAQDIEEKVKGIADTIRQELNADASDSGTLLKSLRDAFRKEDFSEISASIQNYYKDSMNAVNDGEKRIQEIMAAASEEKRKLNNDEKAEIEEIRNSMNEQGIKALSETEVEYRTIMGRLKDNSVAVSVEQASEIIKNAKQTRDETVATAEEQYTRQVMEAERLLEAKAINEDQYKAIVDAAQKTKDETVKEANTQYDTIVKNTKTKLGENANNIDYETGEIKTKWQRFTESVSGGWSKMWSKISTKWNEFKDGFKNGWNKFWAGIGNFFIGIWNGIVGALEAALNGAISLLNKLQITLPDWGILGDLAGKTLGFSIAPVKFSRVPELEVPALATGAVIPPNAKFLAMLGDQTNGRNLEAPESLLRQIVREESGNGTDNEGIIAAINTLIQVLRNKKLIESPEKFARDYKPYFDAESRRAGHFAVGGVR